MKKGSHQTEEAKKRISEKISKIRKEYNPMTGRTGELHPNFGKHWSEEVRKKMSASHKGKPSTFKGKHHTEEAKRKNSEAHKGKIAWNKGMKFDNPIPHRVGGIGQYYICTDGSIIWLRSSYEVRVAKKLDELGIHWKYEPKSFDIGDHYYRPDFLIENKIWWEVKGWMQESDRMKLIKFAQYFPNENIRVIYINEIKQMEELNHNDNYLETLLDLGIEINNI